MTERTATDYEGIIRSYVTSTADRINNLGTYREVALTQGRSAEAQQAYHQMQELRASLNRLRTQLPDIISEDSIPPMPRPAVEIWRETHIRSVRDALRLQTKVDGTDNVTIGTQRARPEGIAGFKD